MKRPKGFTRFLHLANAYVKDPQRRVSMLGAVKEYAKNKQPLIRNFKDDLSTLISLLKDWHKGLYTKVPAHTILLIVAALLYFLSPLDTIPDFLGALGFTDDAAVVFFVFKTVQDEIRRYRDWKSGE
jgi:uncharacterized membrane protein YkvA (DUF1232 family)